MVLDDRQVVAQLDQALAALAAAQKAETGAISARSAAEAGAQQARLSYARNKKMLAGGAITQEAFEAVDAQYKQAQASLAQAEAMVEAARSPGSARPGQRWNRPRWPARMLRCWRPLMAR